jgi:hypothetical protein
MDSLSMSASNELEPGPRSFRWPHISVLVSGQAIQVEEREAQSRARAIGGGGFTGG